MGYKEGFANFSAIFHLRLYYKPLIFLDFWA